MYSLPTYLIVFCGVFVSTSLFSWTHAQSKSAISLENDTTLENTIIREVISEKEVTAGQVEYLSTVTRYGFRNLFENYSYNSAMPWKAQVNPHAERFMQDYLQSHTQHLLKLRKTAVPYFNFIDRILASYGLPAELKYLAVIESNLNANALSSAGALGPWQFMDYTARDYGLLVNNWVDERTDYHKSTVAAARYLLNLYKDLKDWLLVIAAYNGGPQRVYNAIKKSGSRNFWDLQYFLPQESRNHVKKFIATHFIMESTGAGNDAMPLNYSTLSREGEVLTPNISETEKAATAELEISGRYKASVIATFIDMKLQQFDRYNPGFDKALSLGSIYTLRLPADKMALFTAKKYEILNQCVNDLLGNMNLDTKTKYGNRKPMH